ncbi:embryonic protein UVS.2-like [Ranitomeya variabilis]|uniref:embryonic protein UVS.2-like n=1 Tax=Ranitomeya variabilis TaxID=490064 RepID=UPI004055D728
MDPERANRRVSFMLLACMVQACSGLPLQMNFESIIKKENIKEVLEVEPPDVFSIISASNKGSKIPLYEGDLALDIGRSAIKCDDDTCRWSKNSAGIVNVPYTISSDFRAPSVSLINAAMKEFETLTCVRFVNRTTESDYLQIVMNSGCWSYMGKRGSGQPLSLDIECLGHGTIQHELNHALGFAHEHSRSDRDDYVDILLENTFPGTASNFLKYNTNNLGLAYDYSSVMHYGRYAFSITSYHPTILPKPDPSVPIGQRYGLSNLDVTKINALYQCGLCRGLLSNSSGSVVSPNYPSSYPSNTTCTWLIRIPANQIFLQFSAFDVYASTDCASDYLRVYDGANRSAPLLLDRSCGAGQPPSMITTDRTMLIEFISDGSMAAPGFSASYSTVNCGAMLTDPTGVITSPRYPASYPASAECAWVIIAPDGFAVSLNVMEFNVEYKKTCTFDYLLVFNGPVTTSPLIGRYCGKDITVPGIRSSGRTLLLQFHSDTSIQVKGFYATYAFGLCRGLLSNSSGSVVSPNYPSSYPSNTTCTWLIRIPANQIFLQFSAFDVYASTDCASDYLRVYDGANRSAPLLLDRSCGAGQPPSMITTDRTMLIEFISDGSMAAPGFSASYSTVNCGAMLTDPTGVITSPRYPASYPASAECAWVIIAPDGFAVSLNVTEFNVEYKKTCTFDYLLVFNGPVTTSPLIGRYCGKDITVPGIRSSGRTLLLQFHSDTSIQVKGFYATYAFVPRN